MTVVVDQFEVLPAGEQDAAAVPAPPPSSPSDVADEVRRTLDLLHERAVRLRAD